MSDTNGTNGNGNGNGDGNGLILSRNGRRPGDKRKDLITREQAEQIALQCAQTMCIQVCEHYLNQIPQLVADMITKFWTAQGLEVKPPASTPNVGVQPENTQDGPPPTIQGNPETIQ